MKLHHLLITAIFSLFPLFYTGAAQMQLIPVESEKIRERILCLEGKAPYIIYLFQDNTIVYLRTPPYESQTWSEWWNNIGHHQPDPQFYFKLKNWTSSTSFQLYRYQWEESPSSHPLENLFHKNIKLASAYPYLIENKETGEMTLCQIWSLSDLGSFISRYGDERYHKGYIDGEMSCDD